MSELIASILNSRVRGATLARGAAKTGDLFGIELEMEGKNIVLLDGVRGWTATHDGSLRNNHGDCLEWIFSSPVNFQNSVKRVEQLFEKLEENKAKIVCSNRTSTHVHFNMGDKQIYQVINLFIAYTVVEGLLTRYSGEDRSGNLFCVSVRHADDIVNKVDEVVSRRGSFDKFGNDYRYAGLNLCSLNKFNTVEFRTMRGLDNSEDVISWLTILNDLCIYACYAMGKPSNFIENISTKGVHGILSEIFSEESYKKLTNEVSDHEVHASVYEGLRVVQPLAYKVSQYYDKIKPLDKDFWEKEGQELRGQAGVFIDEILENGPQPVLGGGVHFNRRVIHIEPGNIMVPAPPPPQWNHPEEDLDVDDIDEDFEEEPEEEEDEF